MKILYIASLDFYSCPNPSFHLMESMIQDMMAENIGIYYIGCKEAGLDQHIPDELEQHPLFFYDLIETPKIEKSNFIKRYIEGVRYSKKAAKYIKKNMAKCDIVFVQSSPTALYSLYYAHKYAHGKKIIYNVQDMFPGSSIASGVMPQKWMQRIFYFLQKKAYKKADVIVGISEDMKRRLIEQNVAETKIGVIVNWFDDKTVHEVEWSKNRFVKQYDMSREIFYVQYAGTMGYVFDYEAVLEAAQILKPYSDIVFQMIGAGSQKETFISEAEKRGLDNIVFLPLASQDMVSDVYSACSICLIPLKKGIIGNSVPSKAGLLMECRRPIVTSVDEGSSYAEMINENHVGKAVSNDDYKKTAEAILEFYNNREIIDEYGKNGFAYGHDLYSRTNNTKKYYQLLISMLGDNE